MENNHTKPFWMLYAEGQQTPAYKHDSLTSALEEKQRLERTLDVEVHILELTDQDSREVIQELELKLHTEKRKHEETTSDMIATLRSTIKEVKSIELLLTGIPSALTKGSAANIAVSSIVGLMRQYCEDKEREIDLLDPDLPF